MRRTSLSNGFTIAELAIVIAIIGLLATVVIFNIQAAKVKSQDTQRVSDLQQLQLAIRAYKDAHSSPAPVYPLGDLIGDSLGIDADLAGYLSGAITDPVNSSTMKYYYDSSYTCNGVSQKILLAHTMGNTSSSNYVSMCGSAVEDLGNGIIPSNTLSYIIIVK